MNRMTIIGVLASEPWKWFKRNRKQMYSLMFHVESRGHTECIKIVADENSIVGLRRGHKYMCRGKLVSRNITDKKVFYLDSEIILPTDAEDLNEIEVIGEIDKRDNVIKRCGEREYYHFHIRIPCEWDAWVDVEAHGRMVDRAFRYPLGAQVRMKGKIQSTNKMTEDDIVTRYTLIPYSIEGVKSE